MDISKASNFERFVFDLLGRDGATHQGAVWRCAVADQGQFDLSQDPCFARRRRQVRL